MNGHDQLKDLLGAAAAPDRPSSDVVDAALADLDRGKAASRARFRRRFRAGTAGLAVTAVMAVGIGYAVNDPAAHSGGTTSSPAMRGQVRLVDQRLDATPYTFDLTPKGWSVQAQTADFVTIVPDDRSVSSSPEVFIGKLVILFDQNPPGDGATSTVQGGRRFWIGGDSGYTTISTRTRPGEPVGVVRVQYPDGAGWTRATMLEFLGSVHVGPGARPGLG